MEFLATKIAGNLLLPPLALLLLLGAGLALACRGARSGLWIASIGLVGLWALSTPYLAAGLLSSLESAPANPATLRNAQAIVVLGGGTYFEAPEYGGDTAGTFTLERLRWAARLHRQTGLPVLVTGGLPLGNQISEAEQMSAALEADFLVDVRWLEQASLNTVESARFSRRMLARENIDRIALVTHASHMRRARLIFADAGFTVLEAPTAFSSTGPVTAMSFLPSAWGLLQSRVFFHELLGIGWYHVRRAPGGRA